MILQVRLLSLSLDRHPCWSHCGRQTSTFLSCTFREHRANLGVRTKKMYRASFLARTVHHTSIFPPARDMLTLQPTGRYSSPTLRSDCFAIDTLEIVHWPERGPSEAAHWVNTAHQQIPFPLPVTNEKGICMRFREELRFARKRCALAY